MRYTKENIRTGDILGVQGVSFLARAIQKFQALQDKESAHINHLGVFWWINGRLFVIEAEAKGITFINFNHYLEGDSKLFLFRYKGALTRGETRKFEDRFEAYQNHGYKFISLFKYQIVYKLTGWWTGGKGNGKRMICEGFAQRVWQDVKGLFPEWYKGDIAKVYHNENFKISEIQ